MGSFNLYITATNNPKTGFISKHSFNTSLCHLCQFAAVKPLPVEILDPQMDPLLTNKGKKMSLVLEERAWIEHGKTQRGDTTCYLMALLDFHKQRRGQVGEPAGERSGWTLESKGKIKKDCSSNK